MATKTTKTAKAKEEPRHDNHLIELRAVNFKRLKAVTIRPDGRPLYTIGGRNEQGKSSVLDAFSAAVGGKSFMPPKPVREGEKECTIDVQFTGLTLTRRIWTKSDGGVGHEVTMQYADGKRPKHTQAMLDELRGSPIADDPLEFARLDKKKQFDLLKKIVPGFDFDDAAKRRKKLFEQRTDVGRDHDRAKGVVDSIALPSSNKRELVDVTKLASEMALVSKHNDEVLERQRRRDETAEKAARLRDEADAMTARARAMNAEADDLEAKLKAAEKLPDLRDASAIEEQIATAEATNVAVRRAIERDAKIRERDNLSELYDEHTAQIEAIDKERTDAIAGADLPVEGLELGDDEILLDGLPFEQASTARKIRVATALLMATKPDLRVLLVREGSLLDADSRAALAESARENGFVVLMECVGSGDADGIVIEDGEVA